MYSSVRGSILVSISARVDSSQCINKAPYKLTNTSLSSLSNKWHYGDGTTSTDLQPDHTYGKAGTYIVSLSVSNGSLGCSDSIAKSVIIYDVPNVEGISDSVCKGEKVTLTVANPIVTSKYTWFLFDTLSVDSSANPRFNIPKSTDVIVTEIDKNNCSASDNFRVFIIEPIQSYNLDTSIVIGDQVRLPLSGEDVYIFDWTPTEGLSCLDCSYPIVKPLEDIVYDVKVADVRNCFNDAYRYTIEVKPETFVKTYLLLKRFIFHAID